VELQLHGGVAVVDAVMQALATAGLRLAGAGEFTRRAFENGKVDLSQAEAIADLVDAETLGQARQATAQLRGDLGVRYAAWRSDLVGVLAHLEAAVDFPDEDIPPDVAARALIPLEALVQELDRALADGARGRRVRDGYKVAIMGAPNAGKSSLFNLLLGREATIVTPVPGTTRDVVEVVLTLDSFRIVLADMAGLRTTADGIEAEGIRRALAWARSADLRIWVVDQSDRHGDWRAGSDIVRSGDLCVLNKFDLVEEPVCRQTRTFAEASGLEVLEASLRFGGADAVQSWLGRRVQRDLSGTDFPATTRLRHTKLLADARDHVLSALHTLNQPELASEDVRLACRALERVTGAVGAEDVLDRVFSSFCIGK
jgi:tRNA modification GTPase